MTARITMLAMLLPKRSPAARSGAPRRTAEMSVTISGSEVAAARNTEPTHTPPHLVRAAITSPPRARNVPAPTIASALMSRVMMSDVMKSYPRTTSARLARRRVRDGAGGAAGDGAWIAIGDVAPAGLVEPVERLLQHPSCHLHTAQPQWVECRRERAQQRAAPAFQYRVEPVVDDTAGARIAPGARKHDRAVLRPCAVRQREGPHTIPWYRGVDGDEAARDVLLYAGVAQSAEVRVHHRVTAHLEAELEEITHLAVPPLSPLATDAAIAEQ